MEKIISINLEEEIKASYIDYSMSVIVSRALPDGKDGFKPVHRRVLYGMYEQGAFKNYRKSARIVGYVLGKYHPHGDSSVYEAIVRMAQSWSLRYPLIDGQGNFGSIDNDPPAAMRYTEIKLQKVSEEMLFDLKKDTVDIKLNFDSSCKEPIVLPTVIPNLLINGSSGIAVGIATNMPPHNIVESINAICSYIDKTDISIEELMKDIIAPDFPTGGIIYGYEGVKKAFLTGRGKILLRSKVFFEKIGCCYCLIIKEIPYQIRKEDLIKKTLKLIKEEKLEGISKIRDESDRTGMRIVFYLKKNVNKHLLLKNIFKSTPLETTFSVNNIALVNGKPVQLNLKDIIKHFVNHRHEVLIRRSKFDLKNAKEKAHIIKGFYLVLDNIETVIELIKSSKEKNHAKKKLLIKFNLSEKQVQAILNLKLNSLTKLENEKIKKDYLKLKKDIYYYTNIKTDIFFQKKIIKKELKKIKEKYGDLRRTQIDYLGIKSSLYDVIPNKKVVISHVGNGKKDFLKQILVANNHQYMLFFTEKGFFFFLRVFEIPEGILIKRKKEDKICSSILVKNIKDKNYMKKKYVILITKFGLIKKTTLEQYTKKKNNAINIKKGDSIIDAKLTDGKSEVIIAVKNGKIIRFHESTIEKLCLKRFLLKEEKVIGMICINDFKKEYILVVSEKGFVKKYNLSPYIIVKGIKRINLTDITGDLIAIKNVINKNDIIIINKSGLTIRITVEKIATKSGKLINLKDNDKIADVAYDRSLNIYNECG
ncbi:MAG: DNA gyrase A subunit [Candidatus Karelsulcia muelleri]|nr:MAG: DNA gyrase A subunit [Candidatus Karelsulcia muelleri]